MPISFQNKSFQLCLCDSYCKILNCCIELLVNANTEIAIKHNFKVYSFSYSVHYLHIFQKAWCRKVKADLQQLGCLLLGCFIDDSGANTILFWRPCTDLSPSRLLMLILMNVLGTEQRKYTDLTTWLEISLFSKEMQRSIFLIRWSLTWKKKRANLGPWSLEANQRSEARRALHHNMNSCFPVLNWIEYNYLSPREDLMHKFILFLLNHKVDNKTIQLHGQTTEEKFKVKFKFRYLKCRLSNKTQTSPVISPVKRSSQVQSTTGCSLHASPIT